MLELLILLMSLLVFTSIGIDKEKFKRDTQSRATLPGVNLIPIKAQGLGPWC